MVFGETKRGLRRVARSRLLSARTHVAEIAQVNAEKHQSPSGNDFLGKVLSVLLFTTLGETDSSAIHGRIRGSSKQYQIPLSRSSGESRLRTPGDADGVGWHHHGSVHSLFALHPPRSHLAES